VRGKAHTFKFEKSSNVNTSKPGEKVHMDLSGPFVPTLGGKIYRALFLDEKSDVVTTTLLSKKSDQADALENYRILMKAQYGVDVKVEKSDGGGEYTSNEHKRECLDRGVEQRFSSPYTPEQNGKAERKNRTLDEAISTVMFESGAPSQMWGEANEWVTFTCTHNNIPKFKSESGEFVSRLNILRGDETKFDPENFRIFGTEAWAYIPKQIRQGPKSHIRMKATQCIFLGYMTEMKAYRPWDIENGKVIRAAFQHVVTNEDSFPWKDKRN
jgi:hypothetical protein